MTNIQETNKENIETTSRRGGTVSNGMNPVRDKNMWYVYVLKSQKDGKLYTGFTGDLRKRLRQHEDGKNSSTKYRGPFILMYYEAGINEEDARAREKYLKSGMGKRYINNRLKRFLSLTG